MKVLIITLAILAIFVRCQSDHPMLGKPDHYRPLPTPTPEQAQPQPSTQNAMEVHLLTQPQPNRDHPILGQNDGHDNIHQGKTPFPGPTANKNIPRPGQNEQDGKDHRQGGEDNRKGVKICNKPRQIPSPTQPGSAIEMNTDAKLQHQLPTTKSPVAPAFVGQPATDQIPDMSINPTRQTIEDEDDFEYEEEQEQSDRHHRRRHSKWGKVVFPILGLMALLVILKKCIKRRRWNMRMRQQQMMQQNAPAIVPVQRSLPEQLMYHRQEAQRLQMLIQQQYQQQQQQQLYEPSYDAMYGQPMQRY